MEIEETLAILKPEAFRDGHAAAIERRLTGIGLEIVERKIMTLTREQAEDHYSEHRGKFFFTKIVTRLSSGPSGVLILRAKDAIARLRDEMGEYDETKRLPGTIRGDYMEVGQDVGENYIHGSADAKAAGEEVSRARKWIRES